MLYAHLFYFFCLSLSLYASSENQQLSGGGPSDAVKLSDLAKTGDSVAPDVCPNALRDRAVYAVRNADKGNEGKALEDYVKRCFSRKGFSVIPSSYSDGENGIDGLFCLDGKYYNPKTGHVISQEREGCLPIYIAVESKYTKAGEGQLKKKAITVPMKDGEEKLADQMSELWFKAVLKTLMNEKKNKFKKANIDHYKLLFNSQRNVVYPFLVRCLARADKEGEVKLHLLEVSGMEKYHRAIMQAVVEG